MTLIEDRDGQATKNTALDDAEPESTWRTDGLDTQVHIQCIFFFFTWSVYLHALIL